MDGFELVGNDKIVELLNVSTALCSRCNGPARVPEDVLAIVGRKSGENEKAEAALVLCQPCVREIMEGTEDE